MTTLDDFMPDAPGATGGVDLDVLRLNETPVLVIAFTHKVGAATTHYLDLPNLRAELQCNVGPEPRCLLCDLSHRRTSRAVLPVYDVASARVKAVLISDTRDPHSLGPQLKAELRKGGLADRYLALARSGSKFTVRSAPARPGHDMGEAAIADFVARLESGLVQLDRVLPVYPNAELWDVPELERSAVAAGLDRASYVGDGGRTLEPRDAMTTTVIDDEQALAEFRATRFSAGALAPVVRSSPICLINAPVGVGKSTLLDDLLDHFLADASFDLIVVLAALTANLLERRLVRTPTPGVRRLRPRPRVDCGPLDPAWRLHERHGTAAYAKHHLCRPCPRFDGCFWPGQYGSGLKGARVVFGTHQHLLVNPRFLSHLRGMTGAVRLLLLLDEADVLAAPFRTTLSPRVLAQFVAAVRRAALPEDARRAWAEPASLLAGASTADLRTDAWSFPLPSPDQALAIQEAGLAADPGFRWPGHDLHAFARARPDRRWRDRRGNVVFVRTPYVAERTAIFSAGMPADYVARQLGAPAVAEPFAAVRCQHRETRFFNLCSLLGAAARFRRNHPQILDFFALLILRNVAAGRTTLLVTRKRFKRLCAEYLQRRLTRWGVAATVVPSDGEPPSHAGPAVVPLLHFGVNGVNAFEAYDAAYCVCGYLIDEEVLREAVADVEPDALRFPVAIRVAGRPRRRLAGTFDDRYRASDADRIARAYHRQHETNVVIQAVGRVRFATRPREVITFQPSDMPGVRLTREFANLREARDYFGLPTGSEHDRRRQEGEALRLRAEGLATSAIAARLGVSERTVRYRLAAARRRDR